MLKKCNQNTTRLNVSRMVSDSNTNKPQMNRKQQQQQNHQTELIIERIKYGCVCVSALRIAIRQHKYRVPYLFYEMLETTLESACKLNAFCLAFRC